MDRLATYGTLRPGECNHHHVADLEGRWFSGTVRGRLLPHGWGAGLGFPGIVLDDNAPEIAVDVLESPALTDHWGRLDAFEGDEYRRASVVVATDDGPIEAFIYVVADVA